MSRVRHVGYRPPLPARSLRRVFLSLDISGQLSSQLPDRDAESSRPSIHQSWAVGPRQQVQVGCCTKATIAVPGPVGDQQASGASHTWTRRTQAHPGVRIFPSPSCGQSKPKPVVLVAAIHKLPTFINATVHSATGIPQVSASHLHACVPFKRMRRGDCAPPLFSSSWHDSRPSTPANKDTVRPHSTHMVVASADASECAARRCGLSILVIAPAGERAVGSHTACVT